MDKYSYFNVKVKKKRKDGRPALLDVKIYYRAINQTKSNNSPQKSILLAQEWADR